MAWETALRPVAAASSKTKLASWSVRRPNVSWLRHSVHAQPNGERGLPVSLWQACNRTRSVIRWPALCLLALSVPTVWPSLFLSSVALISSLLHLCLRLCAAQYPPHHPLPLSTAEEAKQHRPTHPPVSRHPIMQPTHRLFCFIPDQFTKSTCRQCHIGHISPSWSARLSA